MKQIKAQVKPKHEIWVQMTKFLNKVDKIRGQVIHQTYSPIWTQIEGQIGEQVKNMVVEKYV